MTDAPVLHGYFRSSASWRVRIALIHPLQKLNVLARLRGAGLAEEAVTGWVRDVIEGGLAACAALIADRDGPYCSGRR